MALQDHPENSDAGRAAKAEAEAADTAAREVADRVAAETAQGFRGAEVDPTPNEAYSVAGQIAGHGTPETDDETAAYAVLGRTAADQSAAGAAQK